MANMNIRRRTAMRGAGSAIDWESIARGLLDNTLSFELPADVVVRTQAAGQLQSRLNMTGYATVKSGVSTIGSSSFQDCQKLQGVTLPSTGLSTIATDAFNNCKSLTTIDIPASVTAIQTRAFYNCSGLVTMIVRNTTPPTMPDNAVLNTNSLTSIYVPDASVNAYKAATGWSSKASIIKPISDMT